MKTVQIIASSPAKSRVMAFLCKFIFNPRQVENEIRLYSSFGSGKTRCGRCLPILRPVVAYLVFAGGRMRIIAWTKSFWIKEESTAGRKARKSTQNGDDRMDRVAQ
jgi:hypothetical protein